MENFKNTCPRKTCLLCLIIWHVLAERREFFNSRIREKYKIFERIFCYEISKLVDLHYFYSYFFLSLQNVLIVKSELRFSFENKLLLYIMIFIPVGMYKAQIWRQARKCYVNEGQVFQNKTWRFITEAPLFTAINLLHTCTEMPYVIQSNSRINISHAGRLEERDNSIAINLQNNSNDTRCLKQSHFHDLTYWRNNRSSLS